MTIQLKGLQKLLADQRITIELTPSAQDHIVDVGYDPNFGARPIKRAIQRELENSLATKILDLTFTEGDHILISLEKGELSFNKKPEPEKAKEEDKDDKDKEKQVKKLVSK